MKKDNRVAGKVSTKTVLVEGHTKAMDDGRVRAVLTKEIEDRDGEVIDVSGIDISKYQKNPVLIDAHELRGSVIDTLLGRIVEVEKGCDDDGIKCLQGYIEFAPSPKGRIAKELVMSGFAKTLSIGFSIKEYDAEARRITSSELYETSMVLVPSNTEAEMSRVKSLSEKSIDKVYDALNLNEVGKKLRLLDKIHPKIKLYRKYLMSDAVCKALGYTKSGKEIADIKALSDLIVSAKRENPKKQVATPRKTISRDQAVALVSELLSGLDL